MYKILIDTTKRFEKSVKLFSEGKEVDSKFGDIDVVSSTQELLKTNKVKFKDIDEFDCNPGPGSFTGIKVGITITNVLNWVLGKKSIKKPMYGAEPNITLKK